MESLNKDYTTAAKEKEIKLQNAFSQRENEYILKIDELQKTIQTLTWQVSEISSESIQKQQSQTEQTLTQYNQHSQQIQSLRQQLSRQQQLIQELNKEVMDLHIINESNQRLLTTKEHEIIALKEKLKITQFLNVYQSENMVALTFPTNIESDDELSIRRGPQYMPKSRSNTDRGHPFGNASNRQLFNMSSINVFPDMSSPAIMEDIVCTNLSLGVFIKLSYTIIRRKMTWRMKIF